MDDSKNRCQPRSRGSCPCCSFGMASMATCMHASLSRGMLLLLLQVNGTAVYSKLKWESGVHRVQRVPATETQGRIHTSTATVAIMPEVSCSIEWTAQPVCWQCEGDSDACLSGLT